MLRIVLPFAAGLMLCTGPLRAEIPGNKIRIGVLTDMSGPFSDQVGAGSVAAAKLAVEDFAPESGGMQVEIVDGGTVLTRAVHIGLANESDAEVVSGLAVGDLVVANAGSSLRSGDHVRPIFPDLQDAR